MQQGLISKLYFLWGKVTHSIPILHKELHRNRYLRYVSYSIPLACTLALLLSVFLMGGKAYASPITCFDVDGYTHENSYTLTNTTEGCDYRPILTQPTLNTTTLTPTISMSIDGSSGLSASEQIVAEYNKSNYSTHTVNVNASNVSAYTLTLSDVKISGPTNLTGVSNTKGSALTNNSWGYGWDSTSTSNDNITYNSTTSKNLADVSISNNTLNLSKKLVFATKFGENANSGGYKVTATLSLTATPATITDTYVKWDNLVYMQDMNPQACSDVAIGTTKTLTDIRDDSTYTVAKLSDNKCWMTQNLRITGDSMKSGLDKTITSYDSDISANFTIPASALWSDTSYTTSHAYYNNNTTYGAYYNWYTATAGTGTNSVSSGDASSSICPKGWRLPKGTPGTGTNEFAVVAGLTSTNVAANTSYWSSLSSPSFANNALTVNGVTFPAAGGVNTNNGSLYNAGSYGYYWSSTASSSYNAYYLYFSSGNFYPANYNYKCFGTSVRCVAH